MKIEPRNIFAGIMIVIIGIFIYSLIQLASSNHDRTKIIINSNIEELEWDGCQYLVFDGYKKGGIVHKANCKNH